MLTETWTTTDFADAEFFLQKYAIYRAERDIPDNLKNKRKRLSLHGGSAIAIKRNIPHTNIPFTSDYLRQSAVFVLIDAGSCSIALIVVYNPPSNSKYRASINEWITLLNFIENHKTDYHILGGDMNLLKTNWNINESADENERLFINEFEQRNYIQLVNFNTTRSSILDLILTKDPEIFQSIIECNSVMPNGPSSNHYPIRFSVCIKSNHKYYKNITNHKKEYSFSKCDFNALASLMIETPFVPKCYSNCDKNIEEFYSWIYQLIEQVTPVGTLHRSSLAPWVSSSTSHLIKNLNTVVKLLKIKPCNTLLIKKCSLQATLFDELCKDLCEYQQTIFATKNSSKMFRHFRQLKREEISPRIYRDIPNDRKWAEDDKDRANLFCEYFSSDNKTDRMTTTPEYSKPGNTEIRITKTEIYKTLNKLNVNKAKGPDELPVVLFKNTADAIQHPLYNIYRNVARLGVYPETWKLTLVVPVFKKGDKKFVENYRPISLPNTISKIFEINVYNQLLATYSPHSNDLQYGFRAKRSPVLRLLKTLSHIYEKWTKSECIALFLFDFKRAFDSIDHVILMKKLQRLGLSSKFYSLLTSYIIDRKIMVKINNATSKVEKINCGVAQGTLIGLLCFIIYIDDLPNELLYLYAYLFADDLSGLYIGSCSQSFLLKNDLMSLQIWNETRFLLFNSRKCHYLLLKGQLNFSPEIYSEEIAECTRNTDLGLVVSNNLKWTAHIETKLAKANKTFQMLKRNVSKSISQYSKLLLYKSTIIPQLLYASECYSLSRMDVRALEAFNKKITKWM